MKSGLMCFIFGFIATQIAFGQSLPTKIKSYLDRNYNGWKLTKDKCPGTTPKAVISGNFNGDKTRDYAVKFSRKDKGFIIAFLAQGTSYKAFVLHNSTPNDVEYLSLEIWEKGEKYELGGNNVRLKWDAIADFRCESDVGGIHYFRNGKFIAY